MTLARLERAGWLREVGGWFEAIVVPTGPAMSEYPRARCGTNRLLAVVPRPRRFVDGRRRRAPPVRRPPGVSTTSCARSPRCPRTPSTPTPPTCGCSPNGWRGAGSSTRPTSAAPRSGATWRTCRPASSPAAASPARRRRCGATSVGRCTTGERQADPTIGLHIGGAEGRLPRVLDRRELGAAARRPRRPTASPTGVAAATTPCSRSCTAAAFACRSCVRSTSVRSTSTSGGWWCGARARRSGGCRSANPASTRCGAGWPFAHDVVAPDEGPARVRQRARAAGSRRATCAGSSTAVHRARPTRMRCATPSRPICSTAEPISGRCRSCSVTPTLRPPSATLTSAASGSEPPIARPILEHEHRPRRPRPGDALGTLAAPQEHRVPRPPDRPLLAAGEVRRRPCRRRPADRASIPAIWSAPGCSG